MFTPFGCPFPFTPPPLPALPVLNLTHSLDSSTPFRMPPEGGILNLIYLLHPSPGSAHPGEAKSSARLR